jgi:hypothetical protein
MSEHGHGSGTDADHHYEYLGEPANEAPGEPVTPGWLTLLGIALLLIVMLGFLATRPDGKTRAELSAVPSAQPSAAAAAAPDRPAPAAEARPANPVPPGFRPPGMASALATARPAAPGASARGLRPGPFGVSSGAAPRRPAVPE